MVKFTRPAMTLLAPGAAMIWPTVHTRPSVSASAEHSKPQPRSSAGGTCHAAPLHRCSMSTMASAAPASASRRRFMGTVPAWPCSPDTLTASLDVHLDICTHAAGRCGLTAHIGVQRAKVAPGPERLRTSGMSTVSCGKQHVLRRTSASVMPAASVTFRAEAGSVPAITLLPRKVL